MEKKIYTKKLVSTCDDDMFMSGEIHLTYKEDKNIPGINLELDLQYGRRAFLRPEEIQQLINNLQTFLDRLK
jgi:hypothetical protein